MAARRENRPVPRADPADTATSDVRRVFLIVNADDLGLSPAVNAGVIDAHRRGIVTSASVMVDRPAAEAGCAAAAGTALGLGLHLELDSQRAVEDDARRQLERFRALVGRDPDHLDSHHHTHRDEPAATVAQTLAAELEIPLRGRTTAVAYCGAFYGRAADGGPRPEAISPEALIALVERLAPGVTELGCHPGIGVRAAESSYNAEREREVAALCDPRVASAIEREGVELRTFRNLTDK